jgi:hypothetical protein
MKKLSLLLLFIAIVLIGGYYYWSEVRWQKAVQAAGSYPYQIGLTNVVIVKCFTTTPPPKCNGGLLCNLKDFATCTTYSEVSGSQAGGMGTKAIFLNTAISQAGLMAGGQLIAGGMMDSQMDQGILASAGGCSGCGLGKADSNLFDRIAGVTSYIIAGFKDKIK